MSLLKNASFRTGTEPPMDANGRERGCYEQ